MIRICENTMSCMENVDLADKCLTLDQAVWNRAREYFVRHKEAETVPVLSSQGRMIGYAWQDREADREIRMLSELREQNQMIGFRDVYLDYGEVLIHDCNELAWSMREYLIESGVVVNVDGRFWSELGIEKRKNDNCGYQVFEIWVEGVYQKSGDWKQERLRSASAEFECVNEIYEANIKAGRIKDAKGDAGFLLDTLRLENQVIIRGTGTMAQDAYDWLLANGIEVYAFQSGRAECGREYLFGKPILTREQVDQRFEKAIILECAAKNSAWGFGDVDVYDYEGYKRNKRYFLLRDYTEVPENNLEHLCMKKTLVFTGDIRLCNRVYRYLKQCRVETDHFIYWNILAENEAEVRKFQIPVTDVMELSENHILMLVLPQYSYDGYLTREAAGKRDAYIEKFKECGINDWSEYFSDVKKCIRLETEGEKFRKKELRPKGVLLGVISAFSGNLLIRQSLAGHPQIVLIEDYSEINNELYYICIRLAEEKANDILPAFWELYKREIDADREYAAFYDKDKENFNQKMDQLLSKDKKFTSQELFVMFHIAYNAMYGKDISDLGNTIIYWEPHMWSREYVREWEYWFRDKDVKEYTLDIVRNSYARAGSALRYNIADTQWKWRMRSMYNPRPWYKKYEQEFIVRFEDLKCRPKEVLSQLCDWLGICFDNSLLETTYYGKKCFYDGVITGFDTKPAYKLYEEFFSVFDRMRICLLNRMFHKENGYAYVNCLDFSRRELQEMFLKDFRWEHTQGIIAGKTQESIRNMQEYFMQLLWKERFIEVMERDRIH